MSDQVLMFPRSRVPVVMVHDWRAMTEEDILRCPVPADFNLAAARAAWGRWCNGILHEMPTSFVDRKEFKQYVLLRLASLEELKLKTCEDPDLGIVLEEWPEWKAEEWSLGRRHHTQTFTPVFIPGWHEQHLKAARQDNFWKLLEAASPEAWTWPEGVSLLREAGYMANDRRPALKIERPRLTLPRRPKTKGEKKRYRKLEQRSWQFAYGPTRKMVVKTLKRELKRARQCQATAIA